MKVSRWYKQPDFSEFNREVVMGKRIEISRVLVGSRAHGLAAPESDHDYRTIYVTPTADLLRLGGRHATGKHFMVEAADDIAYEIGHFLELAIKSNPTILEVFKAPIVRENLALGVALRQLFPHVWSSIGVVNAFKGYSHDQHKRMFDDREAFSRRAKYATAHIRVLLQGIELLTTGDFRIRVRSQYKGLHVPIEGRRDAQGIELFDSWTDFLRRVRSGQVGRGDVVDTAEYLKSKIDQAYVLNPDKQVELEPINAFLLSIRKRFWE